MSTLSKLISALENQLDVLSSASLTGEELESEIARNTAITAVSKEITDIHSLALKATKMAIDQGQRVDVDTALLDVTPTKPLEGGDNG